MAKRLLLNVLAKVLGEYIDINETNLNLNVAVWSGQIILQNLKLKTNKLSDLLHVGIHHGHISRLEINIPWTALLNSPVRILIDGVFLQVGPFQLGDNNKSSFLDTLFEGNIHDNDYKDILIEEIKKKLEYLLNTTNNEKLFEQLLAQDSTKSESYVQQITTKVIDNLEVTLTNIHFRYEDNLRNGNEESMISAGFTLASFMLASCDENWKVSFIARSKGSSRKLHKICELKGLGIYWNTSSVSFQSLPFDNWTSAMNALIFREDKYVAYEDDLQYMLAPKNNLTVKLIHEDKHFDIPAKFHFNVESTNLSLFIDASQYKQIDSVIKKIIEDRQIYLKNSEIQYYERMRPKERPHLNNTQATRLWWKYAVKLIHKKKQYIPLYKIQYHQQHIQETKSNHVAQSFTLDQRFLFDKLEEIIPVESLLVFRRIAIKELYLESKKSIPSSSTSSNNLTLTTTKQHKVSSTSMPTQPQKSWIWSWVSSNDTKSNDSTIIDEEDVSIHAIIDALEIHDIDDITTLSSHSGVSDTIYLSLNLKSSSSLQLFFETKPIIYATMALKLDSHVTTSGNVMAKIELTDMLVEDMFTVMPAFPHLISVHLSQLSSSSNVDSNAPSVTPSTVSLGSDIDSPSISIQVDRYQGKTMVKVFALPFLFSLNKDCIQMLLYLMEYIKPKEIKEVSKSITTSPTHKLEQVMKSTYDTSEKFDTMSEITSSESITSSQESDADVQVIFEAHAPKIIIPEHCSSDSGFLYLDAGYLVVRGFTCKSGMSWDISLSDINAAMPLVARDLDFSDKPVMYLIKPFDILVKVSSLDKTDANLSVNIDIEPELRGELDPCKLARLLHITQVISATFTDPPAFLDENLSAVASSVSLMSRETSMMELDQLSSRDNMNTTPIKINFNESNQLREVDDSYDEEFKTPQGSPKDNFAHQERHNYNNNSKDHLKSLHSQSLPIDTPENTNAMMVRMQVSMKLPTVILDLTYDTTLGHHLILTLSQLNASLLFRPYDLQAEFGMNSISIEDSLRSESQKYLAKTPNDCKLIHIAYTGISNKLSPLYNLHASEIIVNFASLGLNCDIKTLTHLKPFMEVLLFMRQGNQSVIRRVQSSGANKMNNTSTESSQFPNQQIDVPFDSPKGMMIYMTLDKISLDILRPSSNTNQIGKQLQEAFSLEITSLRAKMDMRDLLYAEVDLKSFDILDRRAISKDYVFRTIFCPLFSSNNVVSSPGSGVLDDDCNQQQQDLLHIVYKQESTILTFMDILISNTTSFIAIDAILDLSDVCMANFFGVLDLLAPVSQNRLIELQEAYYVHFKKVSLRSFNDIVGYIETKLSKGTSKPTPMNAFTMNICVSLDNPKLIILNDPASEESEAIVCKCATKIQFSREVKIPIPNPSDTKVTNTNLSRELHESIHVSAKSLEIFVLNNMSSISSIPKPILEPFGLEFHNRRISRDLVLVSSHISIDVDSVSAKVSIYDTLLVQSILTRRFLSSEISAQIDDVALNENTIVQLQSNSTDPTGDSDRDSQIATPTLPGSTLVANTIFVISINIGMVSLTTIDDYQGKNMPLFHTIFDHISYSSEGIANMQVDGEGSFLTQTDFYNPVLDAWEPVVESWKPVLRTKTSNGVSITSLSCEHTVQLTISTSILEKLLYTFSLISSMEVRSQTDQDANRKSISSNEVVSMKIPDVIFHNHLGDGIDVELIDSKTKTLIAHLSGSGKDSSKELFKYINVSNRYNFNQIMIPKTVDLRFVNRLENERKPILNIPVIINNYRMFKLIPKDDSLNKVVMLEPIVEEAFENERYDPITGQWRKPFLLGDPEEWTDASGTINRAPQNIQLVDSISQQWEWLDNWAIDMQGIIGVEIDNEGWEYSSSFSSLTIASHRRISMQLDCVRRRRWTRTRVPKATDMMEHLRSLFLFWDVKVLKNSCREITIRSCIQIRNNMPYDIEVLLQYKAWTGEGIVCGPIAPQDVFDVPLMYSCATFIKVRPLSSYNWSSVAISSSIQQYDFSLVKDIVCDPLTELSESPSRSPMSIRVACKQFNKCLFITLQPLIVLKNIMFSDIKYRLFCNDKRKESGVINAGNEHKIVHLDTISDAKICIRVSHYDWCIPQKIDMLYTNLSTIEEGKIEQRESIKIYSIELPIKSSEVSQKLLSRHTDNKQNDNACLTISMQVKYHIDSFIEISFFSKYAIIDRTQLDLSVWCSTNSSGNAVTKKTYSFNSLKESFKLTSPIQEIQEKDISSFISDVVFESTNEFAVTRLAIGSYVYSDRKARWTHIPGSIRRNPNALIIKTPCEDNMSRCKSYISFNLLQPSIVFLLVDINISSSLPKWISESGFISITDEAISRHIESKSKLVETHYGIYGKYFSQEKLNSCSTVTLQGNWNKKRGLMYSVIILPDQRSFVDSIQHENDNAKEKTKEGDMKRMQIELEDFSNLLEQVSFYETYDRSTAHKAWISGAYGLGLFHAHNDIVSFGLLQQTLWSEGINIGEGSVKNDFEVIDWATKREYQLSLRIEQLPGLFSLTKVIRVFPRFCVVNCMDEPLLIAQRGASGSSLQAFVVNPYHWEAWHKVDTNLGNVLHMRTKSTLWSLGAVDITEIGSSIIHLPRKTENSSIETHKAPFVLHIEVKEADVKEHCSVVIIVWKASVESSNAALSIKNDTDQDITITQADVYLEQAAAQFNPDFNASVYDIVVPGKRWYPFGWAEPDAGSNVLVAIGKSLQGANSRRAATISLLKTDEMLRLPDNSGKVEVLLSVKTQECGRVLHITKIKDTRHRHHHHDKKEETSPVLDQKLNNVDSTIKLLFSSFGMSLILDKPIRKEFLSLYVDDVNISLQRENTLRSLQVEIKDFQIDNYSDSRIYPVFVRAHISDKQRFSKSASSYSEEVKPVFTMSILQELPTNSITVLPIFRYFAVRLMPLAVEVDSGTIQALLVYLFSNLKLTNTSDTKAYQHPSSWIDEYNMLLLSPQRRMYGVNVYSAQLVSRAAKIYFQKLIIHPIKVYLTVVLTPFSPQKSSFNRNEDKSSEESSIQSTFLNILQTFAAVDHMKLQLRSFEVDDAMETRASISYYVLSQLKQDISSHFGQAFGSLALIGSPMGFARKVGSGVKAFFYEPYLGAVVSPHDFILGIGKGTSSLVSGIVSGTMNSTLAIAGTASKSMSYLSGDAEYNRKRAIKYEKLRSNNGGIVAGIVDGGESLFSGFASGVTGLVTKPLEEAKKNGALGFIHGIGLGVLGAFTKPLIGATDGIMSVASGISNSVGDNAIVSHVRPARALERSLYDIEELIITPLNLEAALAQDFVLSRSKLNNYEDRFLTYVPMSNSQESIILSEKYLFWRKVKSLWGRSWSMISHIVYIPEKFQIGIMLYCGPSKKSEPEAVSIPCGNKLRAMKLYTALAINSFRMGNPSLIIPSNVVEMAEKIDELISYYSKYNRSVYNMAGEFEGYRFGSCNGSSLKYITGPESDVLKRCDNFLRTKYKDMKELDLLLWRCIWEWQCTHMGLLASRCCVLLLLNRSASPIQIGRVQIKHGRNVIIFGSKETNYDVDSRSIQPDGSAIIFIWAFSPSPIESGHILANVHTAEFNVTVSSNLNEASNESRGVVSVGFLEKTVSEWWSKYVLLID